MFITNCLANRFDRFLETGPEIRTVIQRIAAMQKIFSKERCDSILRRLSYDIARPMLKNRTIPASVIVRSLINISTNHRYITALIAEARIDVLEEILAGEAVQDSQMWYLEKAVELKQWDMLRWLIYRLTDYSYRPVYLANLLLMMYDYQAPKGLRMFVLGRMHPNELRWSSAEIVRKAVSFEDPEEIELLLHRGTDTILPRMLDSLPSQCSAWLVSLVLDASSLTELRSFYTTSTRFLDAIGDALLQHARKCQEAEASWVTPELWQVANKQGHKELAAWMVRHSRQVRIHCDLLTDQDLLYIRNTSANELSDLFQKAVQNNGQTCMRLCLELGVDVNRGRPLANLSADCPKRLYLAIAKASSISTLFWYYGYADCHPIIQDVCKNELLSRGVIIKEEWRQCAFEKAMEHLLEASLKASQWRDAASILADFQQGESCLQLLYENFAPHALYLQLRGNPHLQEMLAKAAQDLRIADMVLFVTLGADAAQAPFPLHHLPSCSMLEANRLLLASSIKALLEYISSQPTLPPLLLQALDLRKKEITFDDLQLYWPGLMKRFAKAALHPLFEHLLDRLPRFARLCHANQTLLNRPCKKILAKYATYTITPLSLTLPAGALFLPQPKRSWLELQTTAKEQQEYQSGLLDLFARLKTQPLLPSVPSPKECYYERLKNLVGHLLDAAAQNVIDAPIIYEALASMQGRCGGIKEDLEYLYKKFCLRMDASDLGEAIAWIGYRWREERFMHYMQSVQDTHAMHGFRHLLAYAYRIGITPPQSDDPLSSSDPAYAQRIATEILEEYPQALAQIILEQIRGNEPALAIAEGTTTLPKEFLLKLTEHPNVWQRFHRELQKEYDKLLIDPKQWIATLPPHIVDAEEIQGWARSIECALQGQEGPLLKRCFFAPFLADRLSLRVVQEGLVHMGWLQRNKKYW